MILGFFARARQRKPDAPTRQCIKRRAVCLTPIGRIPTIPAMEDQLQALQERASRLVEITRKLADDNLALRAQLGVAQATRERLEQRVIEARARVESALSRLPINENNEA